MYDDPDRRDSECPAGPWNSAPGGTDGHEDFLRFPGFGLCNGPAQVHKPRIGGVVGLSTVQSRLSGGSNWRRGIKFRLSQSQGNAAGVSAARALYARMPLRFSFKKVPIQRGSLCSFPPISPKKSAPFSKMDSSKSKSLAWRARVRRCPGRRAFRGRYFDTKRNPR